jgi:hypothetical protein
MFTENVGQFDERARFQVRGSDRTLWLAEDAIWVTVAEAVNLRLSFVGANPSTTLRRGSGQGSGHRPHPRLEPFNRLDTRLSYFMGNDPAKWHTDVSAWGGVRYVDLYPGIDLEGTSENGCWVWRLAIRDSQFAISDVRLHVDGADVLALDGDVLRLTTALGEYTLPLLQVVGAADANLANPTLTGNQVASPFVSAISNPQLVLSPVEISATRNVQSSDLLYSTFLGGSDSDSGGAITVDGTGSAYVTGTTWSSDFPTTAGAFDTSYNGIRDAFVVKVDPAGNGASDLAYATFLGGSSFDEGSAIAVDGAGSAYVTGFTGSSDFPTTAGAFDPSYNFWDDAFVASLTFPVVGTVTPGGGSLASSADRTTYTFAAGTFTDTVMITHTALPFSHVPSAGGLVDIGRAFSVTAVYSSTGQPAQLTQSYTITVQYTEAERGLAIEDTLALYSWDSSQWAKELSSGVDTISNTVTATPDHFSPWAVLGETLRTFLPIIMKRY